MGINIKFNNSESLSKVYNQPLRADNKADVLLYVHDDVWLDDPDWIDKVLTAAQRFDVVGVAGNKRISRNQPSWLFNKLDNTTLSCDRRHLSGAIGYGQLSKGRITDYGPTPANCELLDGMFLAVNRLAAIESNVEFDERFNFHFYELDFCRSARSSGMTIGTWPISLTHQSNPSSPINSKWEEERVRYFKKWKR